MILTTNILIELVDRHRDLLALDIMKPLFATTKGDCTNVQDCVVLYLLALEYEPRHVVEFSPMLGYSTRYLATAMKHLGRPGSMFTVDCSKGYAEKTRGRLESMGLSKYCEVLHGDAINITKSQIKIRDWNVDLIFIDSDHSYSFGKRYIKEVFPLLSNDCIVMIHDICGRTQDTTPYSRDFRTSLRSNTNKFAEYRAVKEFLIDKDLLHTLTHPLLGGWWQACSWRSVGQETSPKLPENAEFYKAYKEIVGYDLNDYRNFQHPNGLIFRGIP